MKRKGATSLTLRLLERRRDELLSELRLVSPVLGAQLEETLAALQEHVSAPGEYDGLDRGQAIRKYLLKEGRPTAMEKVREALAAPVSRFDGRSIYGGIKREMAFGRILNVADEYASETWMLALPEWRKKR